MATKAKLKAERDKLAKLETYDLSYFFDKNIFGDDDSQNMFVYQPRRTLITFLVGNQKVCMVTLVLHNKPFLHSIKFLGYKMRIKFIKKYIKIL